MRDPHLSDSKLLIAIGMLPERRLLFMSRFLQARRVSNHKYRLSSIRARECNQSRGLIDSDARLNRIALASRSSATHVRAVNLPRADGMLPDS
jgi:hypothetical protein